MNSSIVEVRRFVYNKKIKEVELELEVNRICLKCEDWSVYRLDNLDNKFKLERELEKLKADYKLLLRIEDGQ